MKYRSLTASAFFALSTALAGDHSTHEHGHAHHSHGDHFAWKLMAHGVLKGIYTNQGGPRGDELTFLHNASAVDSAAATRTRDRTRSNEFNQSQ
jgi:hypothetical protein